MARDLTGEKFGRWCVVERAQDKIMKSGYHEKMWLCRCECGVEKVVRGKSLTGGISKSCGCLQKELVSKRAKKHGGFGTRLYAIWDSMRQRCNNERHHAYLSYGGRGIAICSEWDDFSSFRDWAIMAGYDEGAKRGEITLDRIDVNKGYSPDNCRWATMRSQMNNKRDSISVLFNGEKRALTEWADIFGIKYHTLWRRYKKGLRDTDLFKV